MAQNFTLTDSILKVGNVYKTYNIQFELAQSTILPISYYELNKVAEFIKKNPNLIIEVQGHIDSRGSKYYSRCLDCARAKSVVNYLIKKGINPNRLIPKGYGESKPVKIVKLDSLTNDTLSQITLTEKYINQFKSTDTKKYEQLHQKNRRIEFKIISTNYLPNSIKVTPIDSIIGNFNHFSIDNFGNIYTTNADVINKYSKTNNKLMFSTSLKTIFPTSIESSKSFRILLFDKERGTVNFSDNTLTNVEGEIDLAELDVLQAVLVCESFNGNAFWVLDQGAMQLLKFNQNLEIITKIENLNFLFSKNTSPIQMFEKNDELTILFKNKGIATFDVFGTFLNFTPLKTNFININHNNIFYLKDNHTIEITEKPMLPIIGNFTINNYNIKSFKIVNNTIYILNNKGLFTYKLKMITDNK